MVAHKFNVLLEPADEGGFVVKCLELPVASQGKTKQEALSNIKEAIEGYLQVKATLLDCKTKGEKTELIIEIPSASSATEDTIEEVIIKGLPEVTINKKEKDEIKRSIQDMKKGNCVTLESGVAEFEKEKAAKLYMEGKISISGAAETARLTIPEMADYLVCKDFKLEYSVEDFRRGTALLEKKLKQRKTKN